MQSVLSENVHINRRLLQEKRYANMCMYYMHVCVFTCLVTVVCVCVCLGVLGIIAWFEVVLMSPVSLVSIQTQRRPPCGTGPSPLLGPKVILIWRSLTRDGEGGWAHVQERRGSVRIGPRHQSCHLHNAKSNRRQIINCRRQAGVPLNINRPSETH